MEENFSEDFWYPEVTESERQVIEELKRRTLHDVSETMLRDKSLFYRFAKARNFNIDAAEAMLRNNIAWRLEYEADSMMTDYKQPEVLEKYIATSFVGFDKEGCVVRYIDYGQTDLKGLLRSCRKKDLVKNLSLFVEQDAKQLREQTIRLGRPVTKSLNIFDFGNLTLSNATHFATLQAMSLSLKTYADHYPERLKVAFLINTPVYFSTLLAVFKAALPPSIVQKIVCYGEKGWREDLLKYVDADVLPAFLGGKRTDPDGNPLCNTFIKHGEPVPSSYYLCHQARVLCSAPDALRLTVTRLSQGEVPICVERAGSFLEWEFQTRERDIAFAVRFRERSGSPDVELVPRQRVDTGREPEKRLLKCEREGIYTLVFDNSYSWIFSKEVYYRARLTGPDF